MKRLFGYPGDGINGVVGALARAAQEPTKFVIDGNEQWLCKGTRHEASGDFPDIRTF